MINSGKVSGLINSMSSMKGNLASLQVETDNRGELTGVINSPMVLKGVVAAADKFPYVAIYSKTKDEWASMPGLMSIKDALYIYTDYRQETNPDTGEIKNIPRMKIGDGMAYVIDLPFATMSITDEDITRWNDHVGVYVDESTNNMIFYH